MVLCPRMDCFTLPSILVRVILKRRWTASMPWRRREMADAYLLMMRKRKGWKKAPLTGKSKHLTLASRIGLHIGVILHEAVTRKKQWGPHLKSHGKHRSAESLPVQLLQAEKFSLQALISTRFSLLMHQQVRSFGIILPVAE